MNVIDLFSGCGGLSLGFSQAGYSVNKAVEFDPVIANTYVKNHPGIEMIVDDIKNIDETGVFRNGEAEVIIGGPPCQGFSMAGARIRSNYFIDDPRNYLFKHYFNVVKTVKPKAFIMENVKGIATMQNGKIFEEILNIFSDAKLLDGKPYNLFYKVVKAVEFGVPQKRERMILIGTTEQNVDFESIWDKTKHEILRDYPHYFDKVTVDDAIGNLPETSVDGVIENVVPTSDYQKYLMSSETKLANHTKTNHSSKAIERMQKINAGENYTSLEEEIKSVHSGAYGRLKWDEAAPTITTRFDTPAGGRFIHPEADRPESLSF